MEIVRTIPDLQTAIGTGKTVAHCAFDRKKTGGHHAGHTACINTCNQSADLSLISYFSNIECLNYVFGPTYSGTVDSWDEAYCIDFCQTNGVDIVFIPTFDYIRDNFLAGADMGVLKPWADNYLLSINYNVGDRTDFFYYVSMWYLIAERIRNENSYWRKDVVVSSLKDALFRCMTKYFSEDYLSLPVTLIPPYYRPDGLAYSTSLESFKLSEIDRLRYVKSKLESVDVNIYKSDPTQYRDDVVAAINSIDIRTVKQFYVEEIIIESGNYVPASDLLVEIMMHMNDTSEVYYHKVTEYYAGILA